MDDASDGGASDLENGHVPSGPVAVNSRYGVCFRDGRLEVSRLKDTQLDYCGVPLCKADRSTILAFCPSESTWLTVATGTSICIYHLEALASIWTLKTSHRVVTALDWTSSDRKCLAVGCIDGSVSVWTPPKGGSVRQDYPQITFAAQSAPCHEVAWLYDSHELLAALHGDRIQIWRLSESKQQLLVRIHSSTESIRLMKFQPMQSRSCVAVVVGNELQHYEANKPVDSLHAAADDSDDSDGTPNSRITPLQKVSSPFASVRFKDRIAQVQWTSSATMMVRHGDSVSLLDLSSRGSKDEMTIWSLTLSSSAALANVEDLGGTMCLIAFEDGVFKAHELSKHAVDCIQRDGGSSSFSDRAEWPQNSRSAARAPENASPSAKSAPLGGIQSTTMRPISISNHGVHLSSFAKTSKQLQQRMQRKPWLRTSSSAGPERRKELHTPPGERSLTSSLELPKSNQEESRDSPMPFLSPSIPARQSPQTVIAPLDDSVLELPPLPDSLTTAPMHASSAPEDDDSDDETFADALHNSGIFLPGGISVPLSKACGALFAPNGRLLTFFPPKVQQAPARKREDSFAPLECQNRTKKIDRSIRLFPSFGNLGGETRLYMDDSDSVSSDGYAEPVEAGDFWPDFQLHPSSFPSRQSWQAETSLVLPDANCTQPRIKVNISVYEVEEGLPGGHVHQDLAHAYRLLREDDESGSDVCNHNAHAAELSGFRNIAQVWRLLGMLMDDKVPLQALPSTNGDADIVVIAKKAISSYDELKVRESFPTMNHYSQFGHFRWGDHPFGRAWLVRSIFAWAERSADVQHLACFTTVLAGVDEHPRSALPLSEQSFMHKLASYSLDYESNEFTLGRPPRRSFQPIPILHSSTSINHTALQQSPVKSRTSNASSRNASQPTTPYLDSVSSTPPFSLPTLSRQDTRLSTSGSASPEIHRSSFSAAAKYYAQSITDKFASYGSYGTSPPMKKTGTSASPRENELSTSLPGGSWTKSVSFATNSTGATNRGSQLSRSFDDQHSEDAYDSDKTVEDSSAPHTPKMMTGDVLLSHKNQDRFDDEISGGAKAPLLPDDILEKAGLWIEYYAEQLRNWNLLMKAAELENIFGTVSNQRSADTSRTASDGIKPAPLSASTRAQSCSICTTLLRSTELLCSECLHTSHLSCFAEYASAFDEEEVTCPTGCGCYCSQVPYVVEEARLVTPRIRQTFKKKASFTDPMLWRRRNEGDTW